MNNSTPLVTCSNSSPLHELNPISHPLELNHSAIPLVAYSNSILPHKFNPSTQIRSFYMNSIILHKLNFTSRLVELDPSTWTSSLTRSLYTNLISRHNSITLNITSHLLEFNLSTWIQLHWSLLESNPSTQTLSLYNIHNLNPSQPHQLPAWTPSLYTNSTPPFLHLNWTVLYALKSIAYLVQLFGNPSSSKLLSISNLFFLPEWHNHKLYKFQSRYLYIEHYDNIILILLLLTIKIYLVNRCRELRHRQSRPCQWVVLIFYRSTFSTTWSRTKYKQ